MANMFHVERAANKITLGTTGTTINVSPLTTSKLLALDASKDLESITDLIVDTANHRVGIGTTTPPRKLTIIENDTDGIFIRNTDGANASTLGLGVNTTTGFAYIQSRDDAAGVTQPLTFWVGNARVINIATDFNVGINVIDPHSKLEVNGAISSAILTITASADDTDVSGVNTVFINPASANVVIGGFTGGVVGQVLCVAITGIAFTTTLENQEGIGGSQDIYLCDESDDTLDDYGGWVLICDGTNWYDCGHAKHV